MNGREINVAAIQMSSTPDKQENLETAERLMRSAASTGADLVALPELWSCHGLEAVYKENAEPVPGPTTEFLGALARELGVYIIGGSILENPPTLQNYIIPQRSLDRTAGCRPCTARYTSLT